MVLHDALVKNKNSGTAWGNGSASDSRIGFWPFGVVVIFFNFHPSIRVVEAGRETRGSCWG
jgi:hypothetical protein